MAGSRPGSPKTSEVVPLMQSLQKRHDLVTKMTQSYYHGDVVPPSTKSQILRAQKFSVLYYYGANCVFFLYALFVPLHQDAPNYGFDVDKIQWSTGHTGIAGLVFAMVMIRFLVMSWSAQFYHFAIMLCLSELAFLVFTISWWSSGIPVICFLFGSNLLNITVSQCYWKARFFEIVQDLPLLVPPAPIPDMDSTVMTLQGGVKQVWADFRKLWGFDQFKPESTMYDERCGVFGSKDQIAHSQALHCAYMQAIDPKNTYAMWKYDDPLTTRSLTCMGIWEGLLRTFVSNCFYGATGFWLGRALFESWDRSVYAAVFGILACVIYAISVCRTFTWLDESLGVAVAEKEWLAYDVVKHAAQREELRLGVADQHADMTSGKQNLVFMWICAAATASFVGESYLAKVFDNVAIQTRLMMENMMQKDFRHYAEAKWEVVSRGALLKAFQNFILSLTCCMYFGSSYPMPYEVPQALIAVIGAACFLHSVVTLADSVHMAALILGKEQTHRHSWVSEWVVAITVMVLLTNMLIWLYLLPIMKNWDLPVGTCRSAFNKEMFPTHCASVLL